MISRLSAVVLAAGFLLGASASSPQFLVSDSVSTFRGKVASLVTVTITAPSLPDDDSATSRHDQLLNADGTVSTNIYTVISENVTHLDTETITYTKNDTTNETTA